MRRREPARFWVLLVASLGPYMATPWIPFPGKTVVVIGAAAVATMLIVLVWRDGRGSARGGD